MTDFPICPIRVPPRLFFCIYYRVPDGAFRLAAETLESGIKALGQFDVTRDIFYSAEVRTEGDFKREWSHLAGYCRELGAIAIEGHLLTHASYLSRTDGLEFAPDASDKNDGTLIKAEILALEPLNWEPGIGQLTLEGCNTGVTGSRGWCPAQAFAQRQKVSVLGQSGWAYFSADSQTYKPIKTDPDDKVSPPAYKQIYLWAYRHGKNAFLGLGDGSRMAPVAF